MAVSAQVRPQPQPVVERSRFQETLRQVPLRVTIPMAAGTESLNVAAAAAICLYETFSRSAA